VLESAGQRRAKERVSDAFDPGVRAHAQRNELARRTRLGRSSRQRLVNRHPDDLRLDLRNLHKGRE
jgi:hypothetical protein